MSTDMGGNEPHKLGKGNGANGSHHDGSMDGSERLRSIYPAKTDLKTDGNAARKSSSAVATTEGDLVASAGVKLKGEIGSCDTLMVEGEVEAQLKARQIVIANGGQFVGRAEVSDAEIAGRFEGTLHVSGKLIVRRTGRINGNISYGQLEIEPGGELRGRIDVQFGNKKQGSEKSWSWMS